MADLPVPADSARAYRAGFKRCRNFSLLFDRYIAYGRGWQMAKDDKLQVAKKLVTQVNGWQRDSAYQKLFAAIQQRQQALINSQKGRSFTAVPEWRLVVGLGRDSALETGLALHRIYGCPYIPGSALKGMTRAWVCAILGQEDLPQNEREQLKADVKMLFGSDDSEKPQAGAIIFFDALPVTVPTLALDIMNPHYPDYYQDKGAYPTDWQSPVPIQFITVAQPTTFLFGVGTRTGQEADVAKALGWLQQALAELGVGGKTTSGYGYFV